MADIQEIQVERGSIGIAYWIKNWVVYHPKLKNMEPHPSNYPDMLPEVWIDEEA
jgi:hypothetical protein